MRRSKGARVIILLAVAALAFNSCKKENPYVPEPLPTINPTVTPIPYSVIAYLITPSDRTINPDLYRGAKAALVNLQSWYKTQMGNNKTFTLNPVILDTLSSSHDANWFGTSHGDSISGNNAYYYNAKYELKHLLAEKYDSAHVVYCAFIDADFKNETIPRGLAVEGVFSLAGLASKDPNPWTGDAGHALGHAFGLLDGNPPNNDGIMSHGYSNYPNCILKSWDKDTLNASPFFIVQ